MSLVLPPLFHWSPERCRQSIVRHGLKPTTETAVWVRPWKPGHFVGHHTVDRPDDAILTVCLGTTPSTAWALSGAISAAPGETWDLWEVDLDADDEVHHRPHYGEALDEIRVANRIPKSRCWLVGSRVVGARRWSSA